jgi:hypothetical protein
MDSEKNNYSVESLERGMPVAKYQYRLLPLFIFTFFGLVFFSLGLEISFLHLFMPDDPTIGMRLVGIANMIMGAFFVVAFTLRLIVKNTPVIATDHGLLLDVYTFKAAKFFIPWDAVLNLEFRDVWLPRGGKMKYLIVTVVPHFALPKSKFTMKFIQLQPNQLSLEILAVSADPKKMVDELVNFQRQFSGRK